MKSTSISGIGISAIVAASLLAPVPAQAGSRQSWDHLSTGLALGLGGLAAGTTFGQADYPGGKQLLLTLGSTVLATEALKAVVNEPRPDGSGNDGFPSGHTAAAFAAATYFAIRYGDEHPSLVPVAYGAALLTGYSRVRADKHYTRDVVAGAVLGWGLARIFTTSQNADIGVMPSRNGAMVTYTMHF